MIEGHRGAVTSVGVIPGRDGRWSAEANAAAAEREVAVQREEEEWKESMKEAYENAVYRTAQLLYEGSTAESDRLTPRSSDGLLTTRAALGSVETSKASSSSLPMGEVLRLLSSTQVAQLVKERKRIARQLQLEFDHHFASLRSRHAQTHAERMHHLDLAYGSPTAVLSSGLDGSVHVWCTEGSGACLGSLQQGEVATLGKGTPAQWRYYVNMEERRAWERERLSQCVREMEEERARWKEGEGRRREEEAVAQRLREEELAAIEEEDDPNDVLPFTRASTKEQKKLMERVEEDATDAIRSADFQAKVHPQSPTGRSSLSSIAPSAAGGSSQSAVTVTSQSAIAPLNKSPGGKHRSVASMQLDAEYTRPRRSSLYKPRVTPRGPNLKAETPSLQLSRYQQIKAAIAKAIPLDGTDVGLEGNNDDERSDNLTALPGTHGRKATGRGGDRTGSASTPRLAELGIHSLTGAARGKKLLAKSLAQQFIATRSGSTPRR